MTKLQWKNIQPAPADPHRLQALCDTEPPMRSLLRVIDRGDYVLVKRKLLGDGAWLGHFIRHPQWRYEDEIAQFQGSLVECQRKTENLHVDTDTLDPGDVEIAFQQLRGDDLSVTEAGVRDMQVAIERVIRCRRRVLDGTWDIWLSVTPVEDRVEGF